MLFASWLVPFPNSPFRLVPAPYTNPVFNIVNVLLYPLPILNTFSPFSATNVGNAIPVSYTHLTLTTN